MSWNESFRYLLWHSEWKSFLLESQKEVKLGQCRLNLTLIHQCCRKRRQQPHCESFQLLGEQNKKYLPLYCLVIIYTHISVMSQSVLTITTTPADLIASGPRGWRPCDAYPLWCYISDAKPQQWSTVGVSPSRQCHHFTNSLIDKSCNANYQCLVWLQVVYGEARELRCQNTGLL